MKKKALILIAIYILTIAVSMNNTIENSFPEEHQIVFDKEDFENGFISFEVQPNAQSNPISDEMSPLDLTSPSYTSLTLSENDPIAEGTNVSLQSITTSSGYGVSSGEVDFLDFELYKVENDTTSDIIYSNKIAVKINIPEAITIFGFVIDAAPTIREDVNFSIRNSLSGADLKTGLISESIGDSAQTDQQLLHVPFSYSGSSGSLSLTATTDYYFILEPTISTSSSFFEITQSDDTTDNLGVFTWTGSAYEEINSDIHFYLITQQNQLAVNEPVNGSGEASTTWVPIAIGDHSIVAWYGGSIFYKESFGSIYRSVVPSMETFYVTVNPAFAAYQDEVNIQASVLTESFTPALGTTVQFSYSEDGFSWIPIGISICNDLGVATIDIQLDLQTDNYSLMAKVNEVSYDESYLLISPETIVWTNIGLEGSFRNNFGFPSDVVLTTTLLVEDDDGIIVPNMDFDFWYLIDGNFERIPHAFTTNESGMFDVVYSIEDLTVGTYYNTHFFCPADYEVNYEGDSEFGDSIVYKGNLNVEINDYSIDWYDDVEFNARVISIGEGMSDIYVEFAYYANSQWNTIGTELTNSSGYATNTWDQVDLLMGIYPLRARTLETSLFNSNESVSYFSVGKSDIVLFIMNDGEPRGNGEEIDVEFTTSMNLVFYVEFADGSPAPNLLIEVKGRLLDEVFYQTLGYITTNGSGYATLTSYEELDLVGYQYACIAEIAENGQHGGSQLYFKINLLKCTPVIIFADHLGAKGTYVEFTAQLFNSENLPLENVHVQFIIHGVIVEGTTDHNGYVRVLYAPTSDSGQHIIYCRSVEDDFFNTIQVEAVLTLNKGTPYLSVLEAHGKIDDFITIKLLAIDSLSRPIEGLDIRLTFDSWSQILTTDSFGLIDYTFLAGDIEVGSYLLVLSFEGNDNWVDITETGTLIITASNSTIELQQEAIIKSFGEELFLEAILLSEFGDPINGRIVEIVLFFDNGTYLVLGQSTTDINGYVQFTILIQLLPDTYELGVRFSGDIEFGPSSDSTSLVVQQAITMFIGNNFEAIQNSTASFSVTLVDQFGIPISNQIVELYYWDENSWVFIGEFVTSSLGIAELAFQTPAILGVHYLRVHYNGNEYYNSVYLPLEMTVIEPPPKIVPIVALGVNKSTIADHEIGQITISVSNALPGASIEAFVYVNNVLFDTVTIVNGLIIYYWSSSVTGTFTIKFVTIADSVYEVSTNSITLEVETNVPPTLVSYSFKDYLCEGELFVFEAVVADSSGVKSVWCVINGTKYEMNLVSGKYEVTIFLLQTGQYILSVQAEDEQGNVANFPIEEGLLVHSKKTQLVDYKLDSIVVEEDKEFTFVALIYSENSISQVILIINSTEYLMSFNYQINQYTSVWKITIDPLSVGLYKISVKIVEESDEFFVDKIEEAILVIPKTPILTDCKWEIPDDGPGDYISGNITINSYYELSSVQIWIDDQLITVIKIGDGLYSFYGTISTAKSHTLTIKAVDINGRVLNIQLDLDKNAGANIIMISLLVSSAILIFLISCGTIFAKKYMKKKPTNIFDSQIELPEIEDIDTESSPSEEGPLDLIEEIESIHSNVEEPIASEEPLLVEEGPNDEFVDPDNLAVVSACPSSIDREEPSKSEEQYDENLKHVKEYLQKVKEDGLIEYVNGSKENGDEEYTSLDQLTSFSIEIDQRVLPKDALSAKLEVEKEEERMQSTVYDLKEIAEEIEQTFSG